jgi:hypothetical protein
MAIRTFRSKEVGEGLLFGWAIFMPYGKQGKARSTLFYHQDILEDQLTELQLFAQRHPEVKFRPLAKFPGGGFLNDFFFQTYRKMQATTVYWDAADIMALGCRWNRARRKKKGVPSDFDGGHSELIYQYLDEQNRVRDSDPRIKYQYLSNGNFRVEYGSGFGDEKRGDRKPSHKGTFLSTQTLGHAQGSDADSLYRMCSERSICCPEPIWTDNVSADTIEHVRLETEALAELAFAQLEEHNRHPIFTPANWIYSGSSYFKGYCDATGIEPFLKRQAGFPREFLGIAQEAFYGGIGETNIRREIRPAVHVDFSQAFTTSADLLELWPLMIADKITILGEQTAAVRSILSQALTGELSLYDKATWRELDYYVRVAPEGDLLPIRINVADDGEDPEFHLAAAHVYGNGKEIWYALPDVIASAIRTGKIPRITDAFRVVPDGVRTGLKRVNLFGLYEVDPLKGSLWGACAKLRQYLKSHQELDPRGHMRALLKSMCVSGSFGMHAELHRAQGPEDEMVDTRVHSGSGSWEMRIHDPEDPGRWYNPFIASLVTAGCRLLMAMLERAVTAEGGDWIFSATDAMAICASPQGDTSRQELSFAQVETIVSDFAPLNPHGEGSILKIEYGSTNRQLFCNAISTYSYAFAIKERGRYKVLRRGVDGETEDSFSRFFLGNYIDPDWPGKDSGWIAHVWEALFNDDYLNLPHWITSGPAVMVCPLNTPAAIGKLHNLEKPKRYRNQIKPTNQFMTCSLRGGKKGSKTPHLLLPLDPTPANWTKRGWINRHDGKRYTFDHLARMGHQPKSYWDIISDHRCQIEKKRINGHSTGKLYRPHILIGEIIHIGKETNQLEEYETHLITRSDMLNSYDPESPRNQLSESLGRLKMIVEARTQKVVARSLRISVSTLREILSGRSRPTKGTRHKILMYVSQYRQQEPNENKGRITDALQGQLRDYLLVNGHSISSLSRSTGVPRRVIRRAVSGGTVSPANNSKLLQVLREETINATAAST